MNYRSNFEIVIAIETLLILAYTLIMGFQGALGATSLCALTHIILIFLYGKFHIGQKTSIVLIEFLRFAFALALLAIFWLPELNAGYAWDSYDPIRYYYYALELVKTGKRTFELSYVGIVYWFAFWMKLFGSNPVVPVIVNLFFTQVGAILIYDLSKRVFALNVSARKLIFAFTFIPELIWYDTLSSRETICMNLCIIAIWYLYQYISKSKRFNWLAFIASLLVLGLIRTSMLIAMLLVATFLLVKQSKNIKKRVFMTGILIISIGAVISLSANLGSDFANLNAVLSSVTRGGSVLTNDNYQWGESSIARLLVADSIPKMIAFLPLRIVAYFIIPLPHLYLNKCQHVLVTFSSLIYITMMPRIAASLADIKYKKHASLSWIFLVIMTTVSSGTMLMHERYRIVAIPWIILSIYSGIEEPRRIQKMSRVIVYMGMLTAMLFYMGYKILS